MITKRLSTFLAAAPFVMAVPAFAVSIPQMQSFGGKPNFSHNLTFNKFNPAIGTLDSIEVILDLQIDGGHVTIDNDDNENPAVGTFEFGANINLASDVSLTPIPNQLQIYNPLSINLSSNVGDGDNNVSPLPPDGAEYDGGTIQDIESGYIESDFWGPYQGVGIYNITVSASRWFNYPGAGRIEYFSPEPVTVSGYVNITYEYTPVPEPATITLLTFGIFALLKRK